MSDKLITANYIIEALEKSWSAETHFEGVVWDTTNPARGQCAVSALVIQDYFGGELKRCSVVVEGVEEKHFVNTLPDGSVVDSTRLQYADGISMVDSPPALEKGQTLREKLMNDEGTQKRYDILRVRVARQLGALERET